MSEPVVAPAYYGRLALLALGTFIVGTNGFVISGLLPDIARTLNVSDSAVGYTITWYSLTVAISAPAITILFPRMHRHQLMAAGLVAICIGSVISAASGTVEWFIVGRVIAGLGGAALVPSATAAAAAIAPLEKRGRAIAFVAAGFTFSTALGSPLGTAIGSIGGWQVPIFGVAGLAILLAVGLLLFLRDIPISPPVPLRHRFSALRNDRIVAVLFTTLLAVAAFNVVYIFSSVVTRTATGGSGAVLAILLLMYGVGGVIGNVASGYLTDKFGNRIAATAAIAAEAVLLILLPFVDSNLVAVEILFAAWGIATCAILPPVQHRLVEIDPATSALSLSWYTTTLYAGIGVAPIIGAAAMATPQLIPVLAAGFLLVAGLVFQYSYRRGRPARELA